MLDKIALHHKALKKLKFQPVENEHPVGAQILGDDPAVMAEDYRLIRHSTHITYTLCVTPAAVIAASSSAFSRDVPKKGTSAAMTGSRM